MTCRHTPDLGFLRKVESPTSLRALNFIPRFQQLSASIRTTSFRPLGQLCRPGTLKRGGRFKRIDAEPEYAYRLIGQKEVFWLRPEGRWIAKKSVGDQLHWWSPGTTLVAAQGNVSANPNSTAAPSTSRGPAYGSNLLRSICFCVVVGERRADTTWLSIRLHAVRDGLPHAAVNLHGHETARPSLSISS